MSAYLDRSRRLFRRLFVEDDGQDLVEYALLTGLVVAAAAIALPLASELGDIYEAWNTGVNDLWQPPPPGAGG
jgi:Flp pilus assembly pilin Flp